MNMNIDFNVNMYNSYIYFASFCFAILLDHLIVNNYLGISFKNRYLSFRNNSYLYINLILFIVFLIIYYFFFNLTLFDVNITDINDLIFNISDKNNYPLNLLEDVNLLLYAALLFLIVIFNIYLVNYIIKKDFNKYLPKNKLGKILNTLINRYINI